MDVRDIMTRNPITIEQDRPISMAINAMVERKIRHLPVVDERGVIVGIITDRDLRNLAAAPVVEQYLSAAARRNLRSIGATLEHLQVKDVMTCNPITARPNMAVSQAAALMIESHVGSLPVIENDRLVGIITDRDAVKALAAQVPALRYAAESLW